MQSTLCFLFCAVGVSGNIGNTENNNNQQMETLLTQQKSMDHPDINRVLFHPTRVGKNPTPSGAIDIQPTIADGISLGCRLFSHSTEAPTLIFFHGNGEIVSDYDDIGPIYMQQGLNFLVTDYRGYGWSDGTPLVSTFLSDSNALFLQLRRWLTEHSYSGPVFVMGRSLGSAAAIDVAVNHSDAVDGLIIESGFAQTLPLAKVLGLDLAKLGISEEQTFNNSGKIGQFTKPTFLLHGQYDQLIPIWQAEKLMAESNAKTRELQIVPGADHNSLIAVAGLLYFQAIKKFIDKSTGNAPDWRERRRQFKQQQTNGLTAE
ncbi:alpha/beta hydrolase [Desulfobulbus alkaliphilus]|uniref:alpha/beta hydrolase n=1 Tax=Desulfobulbus alkaliphilus TaxID=869814 RepID=UPI0019633168|nr:alpha/beta fold hydrolase [Desulfobulbus alkaliphilus]MBM9535806.1 alpha/beta hydrolase [Desulfobulbus alkaliphilus]